MVTTHPFVPPRDPVLPPKTGGGKIALDAPIIAPKPPPRSIWGIVLPIALILGIVGLIAVMYASGARQLAGGMGLFGGMAGLSLIGILVRGRGAGKKMSWGELTAARRKWFARQDEVRDEVDVQRRLQWEHRRHFHWDPTDLLGIAGTPRMWDRDRSSDQFSVVRVGTGKVKLAMTLEKPPVSPAEDMEPATGHALRKFFNAQEYIDDMPKVVWLQRFAGLSVVGDIEQARSLARAMVCQLAAFHNPADLQVMIVSSAPTEWEWAKWLPHLQHATMRDGCGERRMLFTSPAELEAFLDEAGEGNREAWRAPSSGLSASTLPLRVIIDDGCGSPEEWAGLTGATGYTGDCFIRLAASTPPRPNTPGSRYWLGFSPDATFYIRDGVLRRPPVPPTFAGMGQEGSKDLYSDNAAKSDELNVNESFYAVADQLSVEDAELFALSLAGWRTQSSGAAVTTAVDSDARTVLDPLGISDPRNLDTDRLWAATRSALGTNPAWKKFPVGVYADTGEVAEINLREGSQGGMGMHGLFIGTTGAGKSEGIISMMSGLALTHSPEVANFVFTDFKLKSAAGVLEKFPHCLAAISNLAEEKHLIGRFYDALDGELDRRGAAIADLDDVPDITTYNQRRLTDPSLPPIPALWVVTDEYNEVLRDPIYGPKFARLYERVASQGRSLHVDLLLIGQLKDTQKLRGTAKLLGYAIAARTGVEEESRAAIGTPLAAHIAASGEEGTAYLRVGLKQPRKFKFFFSSGDWAPEAESLRGAGPVKASAEFAPREFDALPASDIDGRVAAVVVDEVDPADVVVPEKVGKLVNLVTESLQKATATKDRPPRTFWLPPLKDPTPADELVARWRGRPWYVDYGNNPGLTFPVALADYPRDAEQRAHTLDLMGNNALVVCKAGRGATTAVRTLVTTASLLYKPERVQFYAIAASGPELSRLAGLPHVAAAVNNTDAEGVARVVSAVETIVAERDRAFNLRGLDMGRVRAAKFGPNPQDIGIAGGDIVLIVDGWKNFTEAHPKLEQRVLTLLRSRGYGVQVVITHTSSLSGLHSSLKSEIGVRLEMKLSSEHETEIKRNPADPDRNPAREVPDVPGRGLTPTGHHLLVGWPSIAHPPRREGARWVADAQSVAVEGDDLAEVVRDVSGAGVGASMARLPDTVTMVEVLDRVQAGPMLERGVVPFGLGESNLGPATLDFAIDPHVVAVGLGGCGLTTFVRAVVTGIMSRYPAREAGIIMFDPPRTSVGVVPGSAADEAAGRKYLGAYQSSRDGISATVTQLCAMLESRRPPPGTSQEDLLTKRFWSGPEIFVVVDGITTWSTAQNPLAPLAQYVEEARDLGLHIIATADIRQFGYQSQGGVLGKMMGMQTPVLIMNGHRTYGQIIPGVFSETQRVGKGLLQTRSSAEGVLVGWTEAPQQMVRR
ncbi:type VII secretion protein EccCa [Mycolicibacterium llatzerense]|uniref:type VII secretion protein EccCa n=1 Tax=Mycolicibacterium llatzerense TaxID=280871 RepID=UPI003389455B